MEASSKKKVSEKQKEELAELKKEADNYKTKLKTLYASVDEVLKKLKATEEKMKKLEEETDKEGEEVLALITQSKNDAVGINNELDAKILELQNILKPPTG